MKLALLATALFLIPTLIAPECAVTRDNICFHSEAQYSNYMAQPSGEQKLQNGSNQ